jgi:hypothetical protein
MEQKPITVVTEVLADRLQELTAYLEPIGSNLKNNKTIQFATLKRLHYCCLIVIEDEEPPSGVAKAPPVLVFEANIDGTPKEFLIDLIQQYPDFIHKVYSCCAGYSKDGKTPLNDELLAFLLANDRGANAFYIGYPGQSREILEYQVSLRATIETFIDANRPKLIKLSPDEIKKSIVEHLEKNIPDYKTKKPNSPSTLTKFGQKMAPYLNRVILGALVAVLTIVFMLTGEIGLYFVLGMIGLFLAVLLLKESTDKQDNRLQWVDSVYKNKLQGVENRQPQNHLSSIIYVKPGKFRLMTLTAVLFFINLIAKIFATEGNLSGIVTIHFARWVILPGKQPNARTRLLFFSNYDGSWENYLGEFIDHAAVGLTAVWSNTQSNANPGGFPNTKLLGAVFDENKKWTSIFPAGARDEQRFKAFARNSQRPELIWYCAYTDLSVKNIGNNMKIHEGLFSDVDVSAWLKRL